MNSGSNFIDAGWDISGRAREKSERDNGAWIGNALHAWGLSALGARVQHRFARPRVSCCIALAVGVCSFIGWTDKHKHDGVIVRSMKSVHTSA